MVVAAALLFSIQASAAIVPVAGMDVEALCRRDPLLTSGQFSYVMEDARQRLPPGTTVSDDDLAASLKSRRLAQCAADLRRLPGVGDALMAFNDRPEAWETAWASWGTKCRGDAKPAACIRRETDAWLSLREDDPGFPAKQRTKDACMLALSDKAGFAETKSCVDAVAMKHPPVAEVNRCILSSGYHAQLMGLSAGRAILACVGK